MLDEFGRFEFFAYRKRGVEPSGIPAVVTQEVIDGTLAEPDEALLAMTERP